MAATTRLRTNNVFGTTTNNPLLVAGVTLNSAGLANLPVIAAPDVAIITLDPNRVNGAPEIVIVTAHTGAATSATITRGAEGTAAREHPVGTFWVHAATVTDWGTDWDDWTPTLTNLTLGNGTFAARFTRIGNTVHAWFRFTLGSTSAVAANPNVSLPITASSSYTVGRHYWAVAQFFDTSAGLEVFGITRFLSTTTVDLRRAIASTADVTGGAVSDTLPFTWATGDILSFAVTYEAA